MIKLKTLRWGDGPALSRWARCNQEDVSKRGARELGSEREDVRMGAEVGERGDATLLPLKIERGGSE